MSYAVYPIAVDLDRVRAAVGSKDTALLEILTTAFAYDLEKVDKMLKNRLEDEDDEPTGPVTAADVLRHMIMGEPYRTDIGFAYGYCLEVLCLHFGDRQSNSEWSGMRSEWFDTIQKALTAAGGPDMKTFSVTTLVYRGSPVPLPEIDDFPGIGYLTRAEIPKVRSVLAAADLSKVTDRAAVASIQQICSWLDACAASGRDLVCTYA